jgi:16S rRNA (cytidine1402-2'-O)-methyltransferase
MPLYIVSTPIGNLKDVTCRAAAVLQDSDIIAAEATRRARVLLNHLGIKKRPISYHDHNKVVRTRELIPVLKQGSDVAVISDAGTPGIADPAFYLVRSAIEAGIDVIPVPGASALLSALVCSGLPTDRFVFENFLPPKTAKKEKRLAQLKNEERTIVFYESPHRLVKTLKLMLKIYGDIGIVIARELTKKFETFYRGPISSILEELEKGPLKGELVVLFNLGFSPPMQKAQRNVE